MTDAELMERFKLSARGLQALFDRLAESGIIDRSELLQRVPLAYGSILIDGGQTDLPPRHAQPDKPIIDATEALECIRAGMGEAELMKKYCLSSRGVWSLFNKLREQKLITQNEIDRIISGADETGEVDEETGAEPTRRKPSLTRTVDMDRLAYLIESGSDREALAQVFDITLRDLDIWLDRLTDEGRFSRRDLNRMLPVIPKCFTIRSCSSNEVIYRGEATSLPELLEKAVAIGVDLSGAELRGQGLARLDLSRARLAKANLRGANLVGTNLTEAKLSEADLGSADMYGAILHKTDLAKANLADANMTKVHAVWAFLKGANLSETNLTKADLTGANLNGAELFECIMDDAVLDGAHMEAVKSEFVKRCNSTARENTAGPKPPRGGK
jgi:uncharacterized protein YjbI with pentapeptide repeats